MTTKCNFVLFKQPLHIYRHLIAPPSTWITAPLDLNQLIVLLHQNKGIFPNRRKNSFPKLYEEEFSAIEQIYKEIM